MIHIILPFRSLFFLGALLLSLVCLVGNYRLDLLQCDLFLLGFCWILPLSERVLLAVPRAPSAVTRIPSL